MQFQKISENFVLDFLASHTDVEFLRRAEQSIKKCRRKIELAEILEMCVLGWDLEEDLKNELLENVHFRRNSSTKISKGESYSVSFSFEPSDTTIKRPGSFSIKFETNKGYGGSLCERITVRVQCSSTRASGIVYQYVKTQGSPQRDPSQHDPMLKRFLTATEFPKHVFIPLLILASKEMGTSKGHTLPKKMIQRYCKQLEEELVDSERERQGSRSSYGHSSSRSPVSIVSADPPLLPSRAPSAPLLATYLPPHRASTSLLIHTDAAAGAEEESGKGDSDDSSTSSGGSEDDRKVRVPVPRARRGVGLAGGGVRARGRKREEVSEDEEEEEEDEGKEGEDGDEEEEGEDNEEEEDDDDDRKSPVRGNRRPRRRSSRRASRTASHSSSQAHAKRPRRR
ncbi:hypothetical protein AAMO2058_001213700 [Amorphochlora amoebiformis]